MKTRPSSVRWRLGLEAIRLYLPWGSLLNSPCDFVDVPGRDAERWMPSLSVSELLCYLLYLVRVIGPRILVWFFYRVISYRWDPARKPNLVAGMRVPENGRSGKSRWRHTRYATQRTGGAENVLPIELPNSPNRGDFARGSVRRKRRGGPVGGH